MTLRVCQQCRYDARIQRFPFIGLLGEREVPGLLGRLAVERIGWRSDGEFRVFQAGGCGFKSCQVTAARGLKAKRAEELPRLWCGKTLSEMDVLQSRRLTAIMADRAGAWDPASLTLQQGWWTERQRKDIHLLGTA